MAAGEMSLAKRIGIVALIGLLGLVSLTSTVNCFAGK